MSRIPTESSPPGRSWAAIAAASALNLPLGSVYAFSVFLRPIEQELQVPRSALSFVFGVATVGFTIGSLAAPRFFRAASAAVLGLACALAGALGIALAAMATNLATLLVGYGIIFGLGGGAAYVVMLQGVNLLVKSRKGLLNGYMVALYPAGAVIFAPVFDWGNRTFGYRATLWGLAATLLVAGIASALLAMHARMHVLPPAGAPHASNTRLGMTFAKLCTVFFLAAASGLTVLSQAKEIVVAFGASPATAITATTTIAAAIACARVSGGFLTDRFPIPVVACVAHLLALAGAVMLTFWPRPETAVVTLGMIGCGYGLISGTTAAGVARYWPPADYGWIAARTYIGWCAAALSLPVLAGWLFDRTGGYASTIVIAGCGNLLGVLIALTLPRPAPAGAPTGVPAPAAARADAG